MAYFHQNNAFLRISGEDGFSFLQGLISQDLRKLHEKNQPIYSLLLNNQGKYKFDFFIWPLQEESYLLESEKIQINAIKKLLNFYKLRAKVTIEDDHEFLTASSLSIEDDDYKPDPRCPKLYRALKRPDTPIHNSFDYNLWRLINGLPEYKDLKSDKDTPIEIGLDDLNAISYNKGCFLGQEGTNKAKHRLIIKQRLFPFETSIQPLLDHTIINEEEKIVGEVRSFYQGYGLGFIKIKFLNQNLYIDGRKIKIHHPFWLEGF